MAGREGAQAQETGARVRPRVKFRSVAPRSAIRSTLKPANNANAGWRVPVRAQPVPERQPPCHASHACRRSTGSSPPTKQVGAARGQRPRASRRAGRYVRRRHHRCTQQAEGKRAAFVRHEARPNGASRVHMPVRRAYVSRQPRSVRSQAREAGRNAARQSQEKRSHKWQSEPPCAAPAPAACPRALLCHAAVARVPLAATNKDGQEKGQKRGLCA